MSLPDKHPICLFQKQPNQSGFVPMLDGVAPTLNDTETAPASWRKTAQSKALLPHSVRDDPVTEPNPEASRNTSMATDRARISDSQAGSEAKGGYQRASLH